MSSSSSPSTLILGAGMTGLAAGMTSGLPVYEASDGPGGICSSYYVRPGDTKQLPEPPADGEAYRFEIGGGHWIFGGDPLILAFAKSLSPMKSYSRKSSVFFPETGVFIPYPLQNHLKGLGPEIAAKALGEMASAPAGGPPPRTMAEWLRSSFGNTLCDMFFDPFHKLYTADMFREIAPQDAYKSPAALATAIAGALREAPPVGYNTTYLYPEQGLNHLARRMAEKADVRYGHRVVKVDTAANEVHFEGGKRVAYKRLISTLPLNTMMKLAGVSIEQKPDPASAVLVLNIGAVRGPKCPEDHWLYIPKSDAGFHRVGFYSHVDVSFLPASNRAKNDRVSIYIETAYKEGVRPTDAQAKALGEATVRELQKWGWITTAEVVDPTWIEVAYTWQWPGSGWKAAAMKALEARNIYMTGRYARWSFQGIADSIKDGLQAGAAAKHWG